MTAFCKSLLVGGLLACSMSFAVPAQAADPYKDYIQMVHMDQLMMQSTPQVHQMIVAGLAKDGHKLTEGQNVKVKAIIDEGFMGMVPEFVSYTEALMKKTYTPDEMQQIVTFYKTPVGQKTLQTLPVVMQQSMAMGQQVAAKHMPGIMKRIDAMLK